MVRTAGVLVLTCVLAGCGALNNHYAEVPEGASGLAAANQAVRSQIDADAPGETPTFGPLSRASEAMRKARQADIGKQQLSDARKALDKARSAWQAFDDKRGAPSDRLATIAEHAHRAERLAQIERYNAETKQHRTRLDKLAGRHRARDERQIGSQLLIPGQLGVIKFQDGSARFTADSREIARKAAEQLQQSGMDNKQIAIAGRTEPIAPSDTAVSSFINANPKVANKTANASQQRSAYKQALAITRARVVARLLVQAGVEADRIGLGVSQPANDRSSESDVTIGLVSAENSNG